MFHDPRARRARGRNPLLFSAKLVDVSVRAPALRIFRDEMLRKTGVQRHCQDARSTDLFSKRRLSLEAPLDSPNSATCDNNTTSSIYRAFLAFSNSPSDLPTMPVIRNPFRKVLPASSGPQHPAASPVEKLSDPLSFDAEATHTDTKTVGAIAIKTEDENNSYKMSGTSTLAGSI